MRKRTTRRRLDDFYRKQTNSLRVLPNFIIIGAARSGTTSLFENLMRHPCAVPPKVKTLLLRPFLRKRCGLVSKSLLAHSSQVLLRENPRPKVRYRRSYTELFFQSPRPRENIQDASICQTHSPRARARSKDQAFPCNEIALISFIHVIEIVERCCRASCR
jgi:hypothetical protein